MTDTNETVETDISVVDYSDRNVTLDAHEDRWAWRARLRRNRITQLPWRTAVGVIGSVVVATFGGDSARDDAGEG